MNELNASAKECKKVSNISVHVTCDTTYLTTIVYNDAYCTVGKIIKSVSYQIKWNECSEIAEGVFVKVTGANTGAKALLDGAAAALAFVGSKF